MKFTHLLSFIMLLFGASLGTIKAQTVTYAYDGSGNIVSREVIQLTRSAYSADNDSIVQQKVLNDDLVNIKIYPNPTKGHVYIDVLSSQINEEIDISIYDMAGVVRLREKFFVGRISLDLTSYNDGMYILKMVRNGKESTWRIIKTN